MLSNIKMIIPMFHSNQQREFVKMEKQITINLILANALVLALHAKDHGILREAEEVMA